MSDGEGDSYTASEASDKDPPHEPIGRRFVVRKDTDETIHGDTIESLASPGEGWRARSDEYLSQLTSDCNRRTLNHRLHVKQKNACTLMIWVFMLSFVTVSAVASVLLTASVIDHSVKGNRMPYWQPAVVCALIIVSAIASYALGCSRSVNPSDSAEQHRGCIYCLAWVTRALEAERVRPLSTGNERAVAIGVLLSAVEAIESHLPLIPSEIGDIP